MRALLLSAALLPLPALAQEVTATDMIGRTVTLPAPAERIVTLSTETYEQILTLGIVPVGSYGVIGAPMEPEYAGSGLPLDPSTVPVMGPDWMPDWEVIAALDPDLVVGWSMEEAAVAEGVVPFFGMQVYTDAAADSIDGYADALRALAVLTGRGEVAEAAIAAERDRVAAYEALSPGGLNVLHLWTDDGAAFETFSGPQLTCQMLDLIAACASGGLTGANGRYAVLTTEGLLALDPDAILFLPAPYGDAAVRAAVQATAAADPLWQELRAVRDGRVHDLPFDLRPNAIGAIGRYLDTVAPLLFPETFPAALTDDQVAAALSE